MDAEVKTKWLVALRSGDYKQGRGRLALRDYDTNVARYCCLGVLCEVMGLEKQETSEYDGMAMSYYIFPETRPSCATIPDDWFGIPPAAAGALASKNDDFKLSFWQIADWIEKNL